MVIRTKLRHASLFAQRDVDDGILEPKVQGAKGAIVGELNRRLGGDDMRYLVCGYIFSPPGELHTKKSGELSEGEWHALYDWIGFWKETDDAEWQVSQDFLRELPGLLTEAIRQWHDLNSRAKQHGFEHDPLDIVSTSVGQLGGRVTRIDESNPEDAPEPAKREILPPGMRPLEDEDLFVEF
jgi:hypothetical protein